MTEMISVREEAVRWNITERRVATLCKNGRIAGAKKQGNRWLIPSDTQKPADQRLKTGAFRKTLNVDMLRTYFEKSDKDASVYFRDKKIWACGHPGYFRKGDPAAQRAAGQR